MVQFRLTIDCFESGIIKQEVLSILSRWYGHGTFSVKSQLQAHWYWNRVSGIGSDSSANGYIIFL